jgi:alpha-galactosidase
VTLALDHHYRRASGTSVLVVLCPGEHGPTPVLLHWGPDLGELSDDDVAAVVEARTVRLPNSALDAPRWLGVLPEPVTGFTGTPAIEVLRTEPGPAWAPRLSGWELRATDAAVRLTGADQEAGVAVTLELELTEEGVVRQRSTLTNTGPDELVVGAMRSVLPVPADAAELLDLTGRWTRERVPQRGPFHQGRWLRAGRHGRTGHDSTLLLTAGTPGFSFRSGTVWGIHLAWSGDTEHYAERTAEGESLLGAGERLDLGEVVLAPGERYAAPWLVGSWSDQGLDGMSARLHAWQRRRRAGAAPGAAPARPVVVNTWEAVYFDHDLHRLTALADAAAEVGAERFVLDDGWFRGRRDDHAGLGDWTVDRSVWPDGLHPLVDHVHARGMDFGLWVEPEMVNVDSDVVRAHPDWVLKGRSTLPPEWRFQQVIDLQNPAAFDYLRDALLALLDEYDIAFLKWDHNRDLLDVSHGGRPAVHGQVLALYDLLDLLRREHPGLEIETCASGGGRTDLGILERTDRLWASDTIDALERQHIQRWTTLLFSPEIMGAHVGSPLAHTTGRRHRLSFRAATALIGHFGVEWDISRASVEERTALAGWIATYKEIRGLVAAGTLVRGDHPDPAVLVSGVVAPDRSEAVFVVATVATTATQAPYPVLLPGLADGTRYLVEEIGVRSTAGHGAGLPPAGTTLSGRVLGTVGLQLPPMLPESAVVVRCRAADRQG